MADVALHVDDLVPAVALVPAPIERFGRASELRNKVARKVLRLDLAALFLPEADEGGFVRPHDDPGIRAPDELAAIDWQIFPHIAFQDFLHTPLWRLLQGIMYD